MVAFNVITRYIDVPFDIQFLTWLVGSNANVARPCLYWRPGRCLSHSTSTRHQDDVAAGATNKSAHRISSVLGLDHYIAPIRIAHRLTAIHMQFTGWTRGSHTDVHLIIYKNPPCLQCVWCRRNLLPWN
jgi:hypothetical protein